MLAELCISLTKGNHNLALQRHVEDERFCWCFWLDEVRGIPRLYLRNENIARTRILIGFRQFHWCLNEAEVGHSCDVTPPKERTNRERLRPSIKCASCTNTKSALENYPARRPWTEISTLTMGSFREGIIDQSLVPQYWSLLYAVCPQVRMERRQIRCPVSRRRVCTSSQVDIQ
jgi:hypothetical protein